MPLILPAAVTPFDAEGKLDFGAFLRLAAWFESARMDGLVVAGTNGEGPSLAPFERRDLLQAAVRWRDSGTVARRVLLGVSTASLEEAHWMARMAHQAGAEGILLMGPGYFREAAWEGIERWFAQVLARSAVGVWLYNFPRRVGYAIPVEAVNRLAEFDAFRGLKDSSGSPENLIAYRQATAGELFAGDETLLGAAVQAGWTGTISGAANSVPHWLRAASVDPVKFAVVRPVLERLRREPQPGTHKALLHRWGILPNAAVRLPLLDRDAIEPAAEFVERHLGRPPL